MRNARDSGQGRVGSCIARAASKSVSLSAVQDEAAQRNLYLDRGASQQRPHLSVGHCRRGPCHGALKAGGSANRARQESELQESDARGGAERAGRVSSHHLHRGNTLGQSVGPGVPPPGGPRGSAVCDRLIVVGRWRLYVKNPDFKFKFVKMNAHPRVMKSCKIQPPVDEQEIRQVCFDGHETSTLMVQLFRRTLSGFGPAISSEKCRGQRSVENTHCGYQQAHCMAKKIYMCVTKSSPFCTCPLPSTSPPHSH
jgi:hypothetical protein